MANRRRLRRAARGGAGRADAAVSLADRPLRHVAVEPHAAAARRSGRARSVDGADRRPVARSPGARSRALRRGSTAVRGRHARRSARVESAWRVAARFPGRAGRARSARGKARRRRDGSTASGRTAARQPTSGRSRSTAGRSAARRAAARRAASRLAARRRPAAGGGRGPGAHMSAPIVVSDAQVGFVAVPSAPPPVTVLLRELGPTLTWSGLALLAVGAVITAALIFRPAHKRLRSLEDAARALGEGRTDVRANEAGGDEVTALARAFNRMATDLEARAAALAQSDEVAPPAARRRVARADDAADRDPRLRRNARDAGPRAPTRRRRQRYLDIVDQETYKLEAIIGDLLDLARLEGGGGSLVMEAVPVAELFRRVVDRHGPALRTRDIDDRRVDRAARPGRACRRAPTRAGAAERRGECDPPHARTADGSSCAANGAAIGSASRYAILGPASRRSTCRTSSTASTRPTRHGQPRTRRAAASACRSSAPSSSGMAARWQPSTRLEGGALFEVMLPVSDLPPQSSK